MDGSLNGLMNHSIEGSLNMWMDVQTNEWKRGMDGLMD